MITINVKNNPSTNIVKNENQDRRFEFTGATNQNIGSFLMNESGADV